MAFTANTTLPIKVMLACLVGLACIILILISLSQTGVGGASMSTAIVSTNTNLTNSFPYIAMIVVSGLVFWAMDGRKG